MSQYIYFNSCKLLNPIQEIQKWSVYLYSENLQTKMYQMLKMVQRKNLLVTASSSNQSILSYHSIHIVKTATANP